MLGDLRNMAKMGQYNAGDGVKSARAFFWKRNRRVEYFPEAIARDAGIDQPRAILAADCVPEPQERDADNDQPQGDFSRVPTNIRKIGQLRHQACDP